MIHLLVAIMQYKRDSKIRNFDQPIKWPETSYLCEMCYLFKICLWDSPVFEALSRCPDWFAILPRLTSLSRSFGIFDRQNPRIIVVFRRERLFLVFTSKSAEYFKEKTCFQSAPLLPRKFWFF